MAAQGDVLEASRRYDVFLSYAARDDASRAAARELHGLLVARGLRVFLDEESLQPGDPWDMIIPEVVRGSRIVLALVSQASRRAWYQHAEVARAIGLAREGALRLIPLFLEGTPSTTETLFGLEHLVPMTATEGLAAVAERLGALITQPPQAPEGALGSREPPRPLPPRWQPRGLVPLVGREELVSTIAQEVSRAPLVTLFGVGGVGKTVLAHAVLAREAARFSDGVYGVSAAGARRAHEVLERIAAELGLRAPSGDIDEAAAAIAEQLGGRHVLLLVDNFEDLLLADEAAARRGMARLAGDRRGPHLLITSRRTLNVAGELAFLVPPLSTANAAALMRRIVAGRGVDVDAAALERLAERLEGHPLTADLAAHRIVTHGPSGEAPWIAGELSGLLSGTWERLPAGARSLLGALSQLPQGAPAGLCAALVRAPRDVEEAMAWGLCRQFQERLLAHALVREFVAATPEGRAAIPHLWRAYHEQAAIQVAHYNGGHQARALEWFRSERTNLDALLGLPACAGAEPAAALFRSVWQLYLWTGASAAGLRAFEALGGTERAADLALEAATLHYFLGEHAQAERLARLVTLRATSAEAHQAHYLLSTASRALGRLDVAEREMQAGLRLCEERPDRREHPNFLKELGVIADALGRHDEAAELLQRAIAEYQGNRVAEGFAVQCLGRVERHRSNRQTARELAERSLLQGRDLDEPRVQGYSRRDLATLALDEGRFREAAALLDAARQDFLRADHRAALRWLELDRARIDLAEGRLTVAWEALVALEKALSAEQQLEGALAARLQLVELLCLCGRRRGARVWLAPCQGMAEVLGQPRWAQKVAQWQALLDKDPRALEEVRDGWERLGDRWAAARCRLALAELRGDGAAELSALFQDALDREDPCAEARISLRLSEGYLAEGTIDDAASCAAHAEALTERHGTALEQAEAASIVARVALLRGSGGEAPVTMLREASRTFLAHGQVHMLATAWAALPHPTARERDLVRLTRVSSSVELLATTLEDPALKRLVERHSMRFSGSGAGLARRLVERTSARPPGSDDLESLCEQWIAELA